MAAPKMERSNTPGIFRRHAKGCDRAGRCECSYVITWRAHGRQHTETHRTLGEAREAKRAHEADVARGEFSAMARVTLHEYAREWIERYQGTGRRGFREETRDGYRWNLERFALRYFPPGLRLAELSPRMVADFIGWLVRRPKQGGGRLSDSGVRNAFKPLSVCLGTARREGLIRHNPASEAVLPHRPAADDDQERARPFPQIEDGEGETVETMELVVALIHPGHRLMFELLAATGVRRSELLAFEGRHLALSGDHPHVKVRQRLRRRKGEGLVIGPLKSRYARRDLPIPLTLADRLAARRPSADALVFTTGTGTALDPDNMFDRVLSPACEEAGVEWAGFHTFRHAVASRLFAAGRNAVQVQRWLGHHSPSFTLDTYVHLLDGDFGTPLKPLRVNTGSTARPQTAANDAVPEAGEIAA
jgi:integrase